MAHRDIKPENVLVMKEDVVKVIDWGLGASFEPQERLKTHVGSMEYLAPEILLGHLYDPTKSDCWSLGVLLYVCLTGLFPWLGDSAVQVSRSILKADYYPAGMISNSASDLIRKLLVVNPETRFNTMQILMHFWLMPNNR